MKLTPEKLAEIESRVYRDVAVLDANENPSTALTHGHPVLVGDTGRFKWLRFQCPCGCRAVIALNLMPSHHPHWKVEVHEDKTITVYPSVDATSCGSHFWLRRNRVEWA